MLGAQRGRPAPGASLERRGASRSTAPCPQPASGSAHPHCGAARPAPAGEPPRKEGTEREKTADRPPRGLYNQLPAAGGIPAGRNPPCWGLREGTKPPSLHESLDGALQPLGPVTMATAPLRHVPGLPRAAQPGSVAMAAAGGLCGLVAALESYRGRDRVVSGGGGAAGPGPIRSDPGCSSPGCAPAGPRSLLWLPAGWRGAGRAAEPRSGAVPEPPGRVSAAQPLPHRPAALRRPRHAQLQPRLRVGA